MTPALAKLILEMEADPALDGTVAAGFRVATEQLDWEADTSPDSAALYEALHWIAAQPRSFRERFTVICKLLALRGKVHIPSLRAFCGWNT